MRSKEKQLTVVASFNVNGRARINSLLVLKNQRLPWYAEMNSICTLGNDYNFKEMLHGRALKPDGVDFLISNREFELLKVRTVRRCQVLVNVIQTIFLKNQRKINVLEKIVRGLMYHLNNLKHPSYCSQVCVQDFF